MHLKMSSAIHFNLDQSKILSSGNELNNALGKCINIFKYLFLLFPQYLKIKKSYMHNQTTYCDKTTQNIQYSRKTVFVTNVTVFVTCIKRKLYIIKELKKKKCPSGCIKHCTPKMTAIQALTGHTMVICFLNSSFCILTQNPFANRLFFLHVYNTSLKKTLWEKGATAPTEQFLLFLQCFLPILRTL